MKRWVGGEEDGACDERRDVYRAPVQPGGPRAEGLLPGEVLQNFFRKSLRGSHLVERLD